RSEVPEITATRHPPAPHSPTKLAFDKSESRSASPRGARTSRSFRTLISSKAPSGDLSESSRSGVAQPEAKRTRANARVRTLEWSIMQIHDGWRSRRCGTTASRTGASCGHLTDRVEDVSTGHWLPQQPEAQLFGVTLGGRTDLSGQDEPR